MNSVWVLFTSMLWVDNATTSLQTVLGAGESCVFMNLRHVADVWDGSGDDGVLLPDWSEWKQKIKILKKNGWNQRKTMKYL